MRSEARADWARRGLTKRTAINCVLLWRYYQRLLYSEVAGRAIPTTSLRPNILPKQSSSSRRISSERRRRPLRRIKAEIFGMYLWSIIARQKLTEIWQRIKQN